MRAIFILISFLLISVSAYASDFPAKEIYAKISPSIVVIRAVNENGNGSIGTGSIISDDCLVITNAHVVFNKEDDRPFPRISVFLKPSKLTGVTTSELDKHYDVEILKFDLALDLALLRLKGFDFKAKKIEFADPNDIEIGEEVIAIGHPEQGGLWTLTYGRISSEIKDFQDISGKDVYQTDTSVNRGNSGGPLLDRRGYMAAINSNIARLSKDGMPITGINFSIKSSVVKKWLQENEYDIAYGGKPLSTPVTLTAERESKIVEAAQIENRFETPGTPYNYNAFLREAEKELEDLMQKMRVKIKREK